MEYTLSRVKIYATHAEKHRAYRKRLKEKLAGENSSKPLKSKKPPSRPKRLTVVMSELEALRDEYQEWLDRIPENLSGSETAMRLQNTLKNMQDAIAILDALDLPRGFGR